MIFAKDWSCLQTSTVFNQASRTPVIPPASEDFICLTLLFNIFFEPHQDHVSPLSRPASLGFLAGQTGTPHPQSDHPKAKMFKVLKDILEEKGEGSSVTTRAKLGGRVRSAAAKEAVAKQLQKGVEKLEGSSLVDLKTGEIKTKKKKTQKEKSPEELALKEAKTYTKKLLGFNGHP